MLPESVYGVPTLGPHGWPQFLATPPDSGEQDLLSSLLSRRTPAVNSRLLPPNSWSQFIASSSISTSLSLPALLLPSLVGRATLLRRGETLCCLARDLGDNGNSSTPPGRFFACSVTGRLNSSVIPLMPSLIKPNLSARPSSTTELAVPTGAGVLKSAVHLLLDISLVRTFRKTHQEYDSNVPASKHPLAASPCS